MAQVAKQAGGSSSVVSPEEQVAHIFSAKGVPSWIWIPIMIAESGGMPSVISKGSNHSVGLFQLNPVNGQGVGYTTSQLQNPITNATIASGPIATAYHDALLHYGGNASHWELLSYTAAHSGHLGLVEPYSPDLSMVYNGMLSGAKYGGWGLTKNGSGIIGQFSGVSPIEKAVNSAGNAANSVTSAITNPVKSAENYVSKHWFEWILAIGIIALLVILLYKGVAG